MKNLFKFLIPFLFVVPVFGQAGFPVKVDATFFDGVKLSFNNSTALKEGGKVITQEELRSRIIREGSPWATGGGAYLKWNGQSASGGLNVGGLSSGSSVKSIYAESIVISASKTCIMQPVGWYLKSPISGLPVGSTQVLSNQIVVSAGSSVTIPLNQLITPDRAMISVAVTSVIDQDPRVIFPQISGGSVALKTDVNDGTLLGPSTPISDGTFSYLLNARNASGSASSGTITLTHQLPSDVNYISSSGAGWTVNVVNGLLTATTSDVITNAGVKSLTVILSPKTAIYAGIAGFGYQADIDVNYDAPPIVWNGTSITAGTGVTNYTASYPYLIRNWIRDVKNVKTRVVNKAISGTSSVTHESLRAFSNRYDFADAPFAAVMEHGINNSAQAVATSVSVDNMKAYVKQMKAQGAKWVFIFAPYPTGNAPLEALNATLSTALSAGVASLNDPKVRYVIETRSMWNPVTQDATYTTDQIHLTDAGNAKVFEAFVSHITTNSLF